MRPDDIADLVEKVLKTTLAPLVARVGAIEFKLDMGTAADGAIVGEIKSLKDDTSAVRERIAALEVRALTPGPAGADGAPGKDGAAGVPGLQYLGVYQSGKSYDVGDLVTWDGSAWHCNDATTTKPGDGSKAWTLMVKHGRDAKESR